MSFSAVILTACSPYTQEQSSNLTDKKQFRIFPVTFCNNLDPIFFHILLLFHMNHAPAFQFPSKKWLRLFTLCILLIITVFISIRYYHIHNHGLNWINNHTENQNQWNLPRWEDNSLWLPHYEFDISGKPVDGIKNNLSGLSYAYDRDQLIAIINSPPEIITLNTQGEIIHRYPIIGANDTEGIAYLGSNRVAVLQEKRRSIIIIELPLANHTPITVSEENAYTLHIPDDRNNGPEGIAYVPHTDTLYIVKERLPVGLYAVQGLLHTPQHATQTDLSHWLAQMPFATDLSSIDYDPVHQHLVLLSDEAQMLMTITTDGQLVNYLDLAPFEFRLPPPQPEGVAIGPDGAVYIVSEPNLFYRLVHRTRLVQ